MAARCTVGRCRTEGEVYVPDGLGEQVLVCSTHEDKLFGVVGVECAYDKCRQRATHLTPRPDGRLEMTCQNHSTPMELA